MKVCKIDAEDLCPGDCTSCDQLECNTPGMIPTWKGMPTMKNYKAATIFVDHASCFISLSLCQSTGGDKALEAKLNFERLVALSSANFAQTIEYSLATNLSNLWRWQEMK